MWGLLWSSDLFYHKCAIFFQNRLWDCRFEEKEKLARKNCYLAKVKKKHFLMLENGKEVFCPELLNLGKEYLVQVVKEEREDKLAEVSTKIEVKGKYMLYFPQEDKLRISKKIVSEEERARLAAIFMDRAREGNFLVRTEACDVREDILVEEMENLRFLWENMKTKAFQAREKGPVYEPQIWIEDILEKYGKEDWQFSYEEHFEESNSLEKYLRNYGKKSREYRGASLWKEKKIEEQLERVCSERVELEGGAYLFLERTKALISIDVNSGSQEIDLANELAALEIPKQLRLRNWSGIVVVDFINSKKRSDKLLAILKKGFEKEDSEIQWSGFQDFGLCIFTKERRGAEIETYRNLESLYYQVQSLEEELSFLLERGEKEISIFGEKEVLRLWKEHTKYRKQKEIQRIEEVEEKGYRIEL